jgi:hypothetical protein
MTNNTSPVNNNGSGKSSKLFFSTSIISGVDFQPLYPKLFEYTPSTLLLSHSASSNIGLFSTDGTGMAFPGQNANKETRFKLQQIRFANASGGNEGYPLDDSNENSNSESSTSNTQAVSLRPSNRTNLNNSNSTIKYHFKISPTLEQAASLSDSYRFYSLDEIGLNNGLEQMSVIISTLRQMKKDIEDSFYASLLLTIDKATLNQYHDSPNCVVCTKTFSLFFRKKHCKACLCSVCSSCTSHILVGSKRVRICKRCSPIR